MIIYLIGARGRLGHALTNVYAGSNIFLLDRSIYEDWFKNSASDLVSRYFDQHANEKAIIFVASGILDPRVPQEHLHRVNYYLPKNVIDGASKLGIKVITFGTVTEGLMQSENAYIQSKIKLGEYVHAVARINKPIIHIQMHTLYGQDQPSSFMFLGQMLMAIQTNKPFKMTSGRQLREYHHLKDEAMAIRQIANLANPGVLNLSHGKPLRLKTIAKNVFQSFEKSNLLQLEALPEPLDENYEIAFTPTKIIQKVIFRDSLPAIIQYIQECYAQQKDIV